MSKAWLPLGLIAGGWFFQRSYQANSWPKRAETFNADEAEYQELIDLSDKAKEQYMELVDESDIEEFCEEYDLDYNDSNDRKRAVSKYLDQTPFEPHIIEALDDDDQERYYQLKTIVYGAETFNADLDDDEYPPANPLRIIIGGPPHSGKSTLMNLLEDKFRQYGVSVELRDLDLASKTDLKGGFDINREKKKWTPELAEEAANLFDEPTDDRVILGDSIGLVSQLNEIVSEPADVAILLVGGSYGNNDDEYRSQLNKWERYYDAIDKPVLMVIRSSMNPNEENYFDPHDNFGVIVGLDRPTYQQREEEGKRKGERKISLENACLEGMVFEIAQAYDLRLENEITPAHKDNIKRVWPTIQSHRGKPKNPVFVKIEDEYYQQKGWNAEFGAEKKNCGCGKDPCVTYGADSFNAHTDSTSHKLHKIERPSCEGDNLSGIAMEWKDYADINQVKEYLDNGQIHRAVEAHSRLDTSVRDKILDHIDPKYWQIFGYYTQIDDPPRYTKAEKDYAKRAESDAYSFAYNEGHSDSRKKGSYHPTLETKKDEVEFRKILKQRAENFNAKEAPPLESYTKDELIDSIAGPQGSATYDEMEYDPLAQSRLSAEVFDPPTIVLVDLSGSGWTQLENGQTIIGVVAEQVKNLYDNRVGDMIIVGYGSSGGDMELEMPYGRYTRILSPDGGTRTDFLKGYGGKSDWSSMAGEEPITKELIEAIMDYMGLSEIQRHNIRIISFSDGILELPNKSVTTGLGAEW